MNFKKFTLLISVLALSANLYAKKNVETLDLSLCNIPVKLNSGFTLKWFEKSTNIYTKETDKYKCYIKTIDYRRSKIIDQTSQVSKKKANFEIPNEKLFNLEFSVGKVIYFAPTGDLFTKYFKDYNKFKKFLTIKQKHIKIARAAYKKDLIFAETIEVCAFDGGKQCFKTINAGNIDPKKHKEISSKRKK